MSPPEEPGKEEAKQEMEVNLCDPEVFEKIVKDNGGNALLFVGKEGCQMCPEVEEKVLGAYEEERRKRNLSEDDERLPPVLTLYITAEEDARTHEKGSCAYFADYMKVAATPTVIAFSGGKEVLRFEGGSKTPEAEHLARKAVETVFQSQSS